MVEVDVLDAKSQRLHQAQAAAVEKAGYKPMDAAQVRHHPFGLLAGEHGGQVPWPTRSYHVVDPGQSDIQYAFVEKQQGGQRLRLRSSGHLSVAREVTQ